MGLIPIDNPIAMKAFQSSIVLQCSVMHSIDLGAKIHLSELLIFNLCFSSKSSDIKQILMRAIVSKYSLHIVLSGPPTTAKTVFSLEMLSKLKNAYFIDVTNAADVGVVD